MNALNVQKVNNIIRLANACYPLRNEIEVVTLSDIPLDDILTSKPEEVALEKEILSLSRGEIIELAALMWLGRSAGGETADDWNALVSHAQETYDNTTAYYIAEKAPLADYLSNGLRKLRTRN